MDKGKISESEQVALFKQLLCRPENKLCSDCTTKNPTWCSIDFGVFICLRCAGMPCSCYYSLAHHFFIILLVHNS